MALMCECERLYFSIRYFVIHPSWIFSCTLIISLVVVAVFFTVMVIFWTNENVKSVVLIMLECGIFVNGMIEDPSHFVVKMLLKYLFSFCDSGMFFVTVQVNVDIFEYYIYFALVL